MKRMLVCMRLPLSTALIWLEAGMTSVPGTTNGFFTATTDMGSLGKAPSEDSCWASAGVNVATREAAIAPVLNAAAITLPKRRLDGRRGDGKETCMRKSPSWVGDSTGEGRVRPHSLIDLKGLMPTAGNEPLVPAREG